MLEHIDLKFFKKLLCCYFYYLLTSNLWCEVGTFELCDASPAFPRNLEKNSSSSSRYTEWETNTEVFLRSL